MRVVKFQTVTRRMYGHLAAEMPDLYQAAAWLARELDGVAPGEGLSANVLKARADWSAACQAMDARVAAQQKEDAWRRLKSV